MGSVHSADGFFRIGRGVTEREEILLLEARAAGRQLRRRLLWTALAFAWCLAWGIRGLVETLLWVGGLVGGN